MDRANLAALFVNESDAQRLLLLTEFAGLVDADLAWALKSLYDDVESNDIARASQVSLALLSLAQFTGDKEGIAIAAWVQGMSSLDEGQMEIAIHHLDRAEEQFQAVGRTLAAASTQISKFRALAMQGQYEKALRCGLRARDVFTSHNDILSIGKIEQSLGNLQFLLDRYVIAEEHYRAARLLYESLDDEKQLSQIDNCLAMTIMLQYRFREADAIYGQVHSRAEAAGLEVTLAEIETNQGCLALYQGRYDRALEYLERSRRRYTALGMTHNSAIADQELAEAYLELNLAPEASAIYERAIPVFSELGMNAELARALTNHARVCITLDKYNDAQTMLKEAKALHEASENVVGKAMVSLIEAQARFSQRDYDAAAALARESEDPFAKVHAWGRLLLARWLQAEAARAQGEFREADAWLKSILVEAEQWSVLPIIQQCNISLGLLAEGRGELSGAETAFKRAIASIEEARAPLPAEEFRTAFLANKLTPYTEMVRICLAEGNPSRVAEALGYIERARSRALLDILGGSLPVSVGARDAFETSLLERLEMLREELNWFYSQMNLPDSDHYGSGVEMMAKFQQEVRQRENMVAELTLQLRQRNAGFAAQVDSFDVDILLNDLGAETALVEYFSLDGRLLAFVVKDDGIEIIHLSETEGDVEKVIRQFHFQLGALQHRADALHDHLPELTVRARHHLCRLYDMLMRSIEDRLGTRRLVVVPHRVLHYVPFHALYDGSSYLIEHREVSCVPSAAVLHHCLAAPRRPIEHVTLLGFSDQRNPRAREDVQALANLFPGPAKLLDEQANRTALFKHAANSQVVHLACHGSFRKDNPTFSSLQLADGWLTVRDIYQLDLDTCQLVVLSACETGVNHLAPGDEWIGLARGFFSAGSPSLLVSQWIVDDEITARLMIDFYTRLQAGDQPASALRYAQLRLLNEQAHPYFWAPFVILGRW